MSTLGAPLEHELPSANGSVYEASPGRTALCTSASVPRARVVGKSTTFRITRASPLSPTHHRKCSPTRRRPPCSRVPTNAPLLGSASSWLGGCGLRRTATRRGGAMCNEQSSLARVLRIGSPSRRSWRTRALPRPRYTPVHGLSFNFHTKSSIKRSTTPRAMRPNGTGASSRITTRRALWVHSRRGSRTRRSVLTPSPPTVSHQRSTRGSLRG